MRAFYFFPPLIYIHKKNIFSVKRLKESKRTIGIIFPETPKYRAGVARAPPKQVLKTVSVGELEDDLKQLMGVFESLESVSKNYVIDEAKTTIGVAIDKEGKVHLGFSAKILALFGIEAGAEKGTKHSSNELIEIKIKRKVSS